MKHKAKEQSAAFSVDQFENGSSELQRWRLREHGAQTLSDSELLSLLLCTGSRNSTSLDIAKQLMARHGGLSRLASCDAQTLGTCSGIGEAKSSVILAAFELGRRAQVKQFNAGQQVKQPKDVADRFIPLLRDLPHEIFAVIHLNKANVIIRHVVISKGGVSASIVDAHEVFREAILDRAASVILLHNHPSGNPEPSIEDIRLTGKLVDAGAVLELPVYDHIIISGSAYTSFRERRLM